MPKKEYELIGGKLIPTTMTIRRFDVKKYHEVKPEDKEKITEFIDNFDELYDATK
jgi:hypothetical protein